MRSGRALLIADEDDRLAQRLAQRLHQPILCPRPDSVGFAFTLDRQGRWESGHFEVEGLLLDARELAGIVVRPGAAWKLPQRSRSRMRVWTLHEWRTAWCALLGAYPGPVIDRMPPGWFLNADLHRQALGRTLGLGLGCTLELQARPEAAVVLVDDRLLPADLSPASAAWSAWLHERRQPVRSWQAQHGVRHARVDACRRHATWAICGVERVPCAAALAPRALDALADSCSASLSG